MKIKILILGLLVFIFSECNRNVKPDNYELFKVYLKNTFHQNIPSTLHYYVLIPNNGCSGCISLVYQNIVPDLLGQKSCTVITCNNNIPNKYFSNLYYDKNGIMNHYDFGLGYPHLIVSNENEIKKIIELSQNNIDSVKRILVKNFK